MVEQSETTGTAFVTCRAPAGAQDENSNFGQRFVRRPFQDANDWRIGSGGCSPPANLHRASGAESLFAPLGLDAAPITFDGTDSQQFDAHDR